jgi:hypothetical protein
MTAAPVNLARSPRPVMQGMMRGAWLRGGAGCPRWTGRCRCWRAWRWPDLADGPVAEAQWVPAATPGLITGSLFSGQAWPVSQGEMPAHNGGAGTAGWIRAFTHSLMDLDFRYGGGHVRRVLLSFFRSEIVRRCCRPAIPGQCAASCSARRPRSRRCWAFPPTTRAATARRSATSPGSAAGRGGGRPGAGRGADVEPVSPGNDRCAALAGVRPPGSVSPI